MENQHEDNSQSEPEEAMTRALQHPFGMFKRPKRVTQQLPSLSGMRFELRDGQVVNIEGLSNIVIGRQAGNERQIDFDLVPYGGVENGVSRTHACLMVTHEAVFVRDLDSSNSTFLNGEELYPMRDYPVQEGDELRFGSLVMRVRFIRC